MMNQITNSLRIEEKIKMLKAKSKRKLIRSDIFGYVEQRVIDEALKFGAIKIRDGRHVIPTEFKIIAIQEGKMLKSPRKILVVSNKYYEFRKRLENRFQKEKITEEDVNQLQF